MTASLELEIRVECKECGQELSAAFDHNRYSNPCDIMTVSPCDNCLDLARQSGRDEFSAENG